MYKKILQLNNDKKLYATLEKELKHLRDINSVTQSAARKKMAIPKLEKNQDSVVEDYKLLLSDVNDWLDTFSPDNEIFAEVLRAYYQDTYKEGELQKGIEKTNLQDAIDEVELDMNVSNFRAKIIKIWIDGLKK
jgi:Lhr-like helicase